MPRWEVCMIREHRDVVRTGGFLGETKVNYE